MPSMLSYPRRLPSGHITCYLNRTYHVLTTLAAQRLVIVIFTVYSAASALRNRQLAIGSPGQQPRLHVLVFDVVSRLDLAIRLPNLGQHSLLIGDVNFH